MGRYSRYIDGEHGAFKSREQNAGLEKEDAWQRRQDLWARRRARWGVWKAGQRVKQTPK